MQKVILFHNKAPGDNIMLTGLVRDIHKCYPGQFLTDVRVHSNSQPLWDNNPYITHIDNGDKEAKHIVSEYKLINFANTEPIHFLHGFCKDFSTKMNVQVYPTQFKGDIHLSQAEKDGKGKIFSMLKQDVPYWIVNAGGKSDFTCKMWEHERFNEVIKALPNVYFVQVGALRGGKISHFHQPLFGHNVINLLGQTSMRDMVELMYHAAGCITGVSFPMHLAAATPMHPKYKRETRPCIVLAGGREAVNWEAYPTHAFMHTGGMLPCCSHGGCWRRRVEVLPDGDHKRNKSLCQFPIVSKSGQKVPKCMDMITSQEVVTKLRHYMDPYNFYTEWNYSLPPKG
jgi:ADP-heptose:LPS heptosyltransferase